MTNEKSPFRYTGGGISSRENFRKALVWYLKAKKQGLTISTICGGVSSKEDVPLVKDAGFDGFAFARVASCRPWKVKEIIKTADIF